MHLRRKTTTDPWSLVADDTWPAEYRAELVLGVPWMTRLKSVSRFFKVFLHHYREDLKAARDKVGGTLPLPECRREIIRLMTDAAHEDVKIRDLSVDVNRLLRESYAEIEIEARLLGNDPDDAIARLEHAVGRLYHAVRPARSATT